MIRPFVSYQGHWSTSNIMVKLLKKMAVTGQYGVSQTQLVSFCQNVFITGLLQDIYL